MKILIISNNLPIPVQIMFNISIYYSAHLSVNIITKIHLKFYAISGFDHGHLVYHCAHKFNNGIHCHCKTPYGEIYSIRRCVIYVKYSQNLTFSSVDGVDCVVKTPGLINTGPCNWSKRATSNGLTTFCFCIKRWWVPEIIPRIHIDSTSALHNYIQHFCSFLNKIMIGYIKLHL